MDLRTVGRIALGVGAGVGTVALLTACASQEKDPRSEAYDLFGSYDRDGNGVGLDESTRTFREGVVGSKRYYARVGDTAYWTRNLGFREYETSIRKAVLAADTNRDALASFEELGALARSFSTDGNSTLDRGERNRLRSEYGERRGNERTFWTGVEQGVDHGYRGHRDGYDDPFYPEPGYGGGNGPGDDGGYRPGDGGYLPPGPGGGNGQGDDGGYLPPGPGGGNGSGDDGGRFPPPGSGFPPPGSGSGPRPGSGGDSTDNGDPDEGGF